MEPKGRSWQKSFGTPRWMPKANFITLHYLYIIVVGLSGLLILLPYGNISAIDAYFFGVSASTESGLNTIDLKELATYQQVYTYLIAMITNLTFINIAVVVVRLHWFRKKLKTLAPILLKSEGHEADGGNPSHADSESDLDLRPAVTEPARKPPPSLAGGDNKSLHLVKTDSPRRITFALDVHRTPESKPLYIPGPRDRDNGHPIVERDILDEADDAEDAVGMAPRTNEPKSGVVRRRTWGADGPGSSPALSKAISIERVATTVGTVFVLGKTRAGVARQPPAPPRPPATGLPMLLSKQVTIGRNSQFLNLTSSDRERLGGIEYRALKVLLKIVVSYAVFLNILGVVSLVPWIHRAPQKYRDWLDVNAIDYSWWGIYSAQTMANNLGFTLTPDSMVTFRDATWPMLIMTFLAFAGNTCYPIFLRLVVWTMFKLVPSRSSLKETLRFLLDHPRRCYTLLFPSRATWILFGIVVFLNLADVVLIIALDLNNPAVNDLSLGPRILSSLFQAASARHTGTATYVLSQVNPAVQFSLLVMMYISVLPIAISIRASNTYEEKSLGIYLPDEEEPDEGQGTTSYILAHVRNQLSFDLWYIFLGVFCICIAEADKIMEPDQTAFQVFPILFEVMSAYGCVGLSLGHPSVMTSLCGQFTTFSKVIICLMMLRGRHRGLPYSLDRAIMLPSEQLNERGGLSRTTSQQSAGKPSSLGFRRRSSGTARMIPMKTHHTQ
ncbi:hypothetical protein KVR01_001747 [Diaporthe batatas]|uniref:uncharacterized protein n=1 Tax=Diaporthe batatas TaxID=748121 RepID=UPI001D0548D2|nr:uncharacterized protein KVR01_001747 [Diaporthe batatas]KAG8168998.1 hypothetical protein KVR01_001747 [Diaporthe batatas]